MWETQQRIGQLALLGLDEIVEEELGLSRIFLTLHHVGDTPPVAKIVFVVDSPVLFQCPFGREQFTQSRCGEDVTDVHHVARLRQRQQ